MDVEHLLPAAVLRNIGAQQYEKRKLAALEVEQLMKKLGAGNDKGRIQVKSTPNHVVHTMLMPQRQFQALGVMGDSLSDVSGPLFSSDNVMDEKACTVSIWIPIFVI